MEFSSIGGSKPHKVGVTFIIDYFSSTGGSKSHKVGVTFTVDYFSSIR